MSENISVLHVIDHMGLGGAQRAVADQLKYRPSDHVFVLNAKKKNLYPEVKGKYSGAMNILEILFLPQRLITCVKESSYQIVHCHLNASWLLGLLVKLRYRGKIKVIFHERGGILTSGFFYKLLVSLCAANGIIVTISENIAKELNKIGIPYERINIIYNGLDTSSFFQDKSLSSLFRKKHNIPEQAYLIGFAGRLEGYKGWKDFVDAFYLVHQQYADAFGVIAGTGPDTKKVIRYIKKLNLTNNIIRIGYVENMLDCYNALNVFVFPSHLEPLGRAQLEAQACGIPVIATNIPGTIETVSENNAIIVQVKSGKDIANAIQKLRKDFKLADEIITAGLKNIQRFNYNQHLIQITNLYKKVIAER